MYVGFMRNFREPNELAMLTAIMSKYYNIDIIYLRPTDVDIKTNRVKGKVFVNNKWVERETDLPPFIDISPYCFKKKYKEVIDYLRTNTFLSDNRTNLITKEKLQKKLKEDGEFAHLVIPTHRPKDFEFLLKYLERYNAIVLKPIGGEQGKGVYKLSRENNKFILAFKKEKHSLTKEELESFFIESIVNKRYILQKYIDSRTLQGYPFDCRVHVEKNGDGKWVSARNYIRIGIGQSVVSNISQGGAIADPKSFLQANFGGKWEAILNRINELAVTLPYKIEEFRNTHIMSLGMDIGIDKDGDLYVFEVNGAPLTNPLKAEVALLRSSYYKYVLENKLKIDLNNKSTDLQNELNYYKKKLNQMENSTSWRLTKPIRKIGGLIKK